MTRTCLTAFVVLAVATVGSGCPREQAGEAGRTEGERPADKAAARPVPGPSEPDRPPAGRADAAPAPVERDEPVDLVHALAVEVAASSAYRDDAAQIGRLVDGDLETAWNSRTGELAGAWLEVVLPPEAEVEAMELTAGYTKRSAARDLFTGNHRVERVRVLRDGEVLGSYPLDVESQELQRVPVSGRGGTYRIELESLRPGTEAGWREACVSELRVLGRAPGARAGSRTPTTRLGPRPGEAEPDGGAPERDGGEAVTAEADQEAAEQGAAAAAPELFEADGIRLTELVLASSVEDREPVDPRRTFSRSSGDRVYCYLRLDNPGSRATTLQVTWERADGSTLRAAAPLNIPAMPRYRTWTWGGTSFPRGQYRAVVRTAEGSLLGRIDYELTD